MHDNVPSTTSEFKSLIDSTFETLLTITTILSGVYVAVTFGWFGQAMMEPHPGTPISPEMLTVAMMGVFLGLIFIIPLVVVVLSWAYSKFTDSRTLRVAAWSGLIYCLAQDIVGIIVLLAIPMIASGTFVGPLLLAGVAFVLSVPAFLGVWLGYRVSVRYYRDVLEPGARTRGFASIALAAVLTIMSIQAVLGLFILTL
ncbi:MAG: hypothetical protein JSW61_07250 [Candidatus Thorarchaeota archaeon]|nr:MAG: hypothetical protein JSW61_07250 [Candidatus Thorarchaeota archaeon]